MGSKAAPSVTAQRLARAAVALLVLCGSVSACEYTYEDGSRAASSPGPTSTNVVLPPDPALESTVTGKALDEWATAALPESQGQAFYSSSGSLAAGESRTEQTVQLPGGTYAVTLACRGTRRVSFSVKVGEAELVDLTLGCANARVSVVQLEKDAVLAITVGAGADANFAYRVSRL
ncbi:hypothetical protein J2T10_000120 [Paenarthrobacter nicotinovorans]|jgi:hypothetical protein|uniref:Lipoprotein n=1 Tax=Paenarthrobacter nicotinovorans TaxID=29320 RepID=A0ABT9TFS3_PAENI|nr:MULTISPECIES: hypothetical protein [Paenarthrobacter]KIA71764.1 lipoprotein [Arthrobacter sp. MWB30]SKB41815.1 hypothetical protein SAMN05660916_00819 [Arthrobacter sp. 31Cvi3.1E]BCW11976.1 hypothetical protein NtRootA2_32580 [Arthrobacter sp. NtRootA2]BCW16060.1 hypothetical protein NtRootA4_30390 [Arthrobacter sp. NtRootA4]BCW24393.1 hypothetical protein NtRootC7_32600 [Arthrobacter sp. NtRootC7]BCW28661.1 hypothetical protein NtRootC45_32610 [Arthrobacter sp. NtRootC45]BCW32933.1 hypot